MLAKGTSERFERIKGRIDLLTGMYRNIEIQIGQIANLINNRNQEKLLSKMEVNPRERVKAITLHSGKQLEDSPVIEVREKMRARKKKRRRRTKNQVWGKIIGKDSQD